MTAPPHRNYYPDTFTVGETFTAFSHTEACRIVGHVVVLEGTKAGGYVVEFVTGEHAGWKLVDAQRGLDFLWEPGYYNCSHADLTHLRRTDGEFWKTFEAADEFACEKCGDRFHSYERAATHEASCSDHSDDDVSDGYFSSSVASDN
jgi:hypothetical protein